MRFKGKIGGVSSILWVLIRSRRTNTITQAVTQGLGVVGIYPAGAWMRPGWFNRD